jgi:hypothetical protein
MRARFARSVSVGALIWVVGLVSCSTSPTTGTTSSIGESTASTRQPATTTTTTTVAPTTTTTRPATTTLPPVPWPSVDGVIDVLFPPDGWRTAEPVVDVYGTMVRGATVAVNDVPLDLAPDSEDPTNGILVAQGAWWVQIPLDGPDAVSLRVTGEANGETEEILVITRYDPDLEQAFGRLVAVEGSMLLLDPAVLLLGVEAEEYLGTEPVDGYHIVDDDPGVVERWPITDDALVVMIEAVDGPPWMKESVVSVERLGVILAGEDEGSWWVAGDFPVPAFVYLDDDVVVQIHVRWAP